MRDIQKLIVIVFSSLLFIYHDLISDDPEIIARGQLEKSEINGQLTNNDGFGGYLSETIVNSRLHRKWDGFLLLLLGLAFLKPKHARY